MTAYAVGDRVELVSMREVNEAARRCSRFMAPDVALGEVGRVGRLYLDGLFEVQFPKCVLWCNAAMVARRPLGVEKEAAHGTE